MSYDVDVIDLLCNSNGQKEKLPAKGMEKEFIERKISESKTLGKQPIQELKNNSEKEEEIEENEESLAKISEMDKNQLVKDWRKHLYNVQASRKIKSSSKQRTYEIESHCFNLYLGLGS